MDPTTSVVIASYNIRKAIGRDGRRNPARILDVIGGLGADIIALQEADLRFRGRRAIFDTAAIEAATGLQAIDVAPDADGLGWHGNVLFLTGRATVRGVRAVTLKGTEPRGAVITDLEIDGRQMRLVQCHLGLLPHQRTRQAGLLAEDVTEAPTAIIGDFNAAGPRPRSLKPLQTTLNEVMHGPTFPTRWPCLRYDRMFHTDALTATEPVVVDTPLARLASDHLPIKATFNWR